MRKSIEEGEVLAVKSYHQSFQCWQFSISLTQPRLHATTIGFAPFKTPHVSAKECAAWHRRRLKVNKINWTPKWARDERNGRRMPLLGIYQCKGRPKVPGWVFATLPQLLPIKAHTAAPMAQQSSSTHAQELMDAQTTQITKGGDGY